MMRRLVVLALLTLVMGADLGKAPPELKKYRLVLHAPAQGGIYFSAWNDGDVIAATDGSDGKPVVYRRRYKWGDGCSWVATETLTPTRPKTFRYSYRETPFSCPPGAHADTGATTPRDGEVTVHPLVKDRPLTPLDVWARDWD